MRSLIVATLSLSVAFTYAQELVPDPRFEIPNCDNYPQPEHWINPNEATADVIATDGCGVQLTYGHL